MIRPFHRLDAAFALAMLAACSGPRYFRPTEQTLAETADGALAAVYEVRFGEQRWGDVRVWSNGADTQEIGGASRAVVHVGFEVRNALDAPLELDLAHTRLEAIDAGGGSAASLEPTTTTGDPRAAPHSVGRLDFEFVLAADTSRADLRSFRIHWWLHGPDERVYEQYTEFVPDRSYYRYYYGPYWYGPYYRPWYWGYGFYWCPAP